MLRSWSKRTLESSRDVLSLTDPGASCAYGAEEAQGGKGTPPSLLPPKVLGSPAVARGPSSHLLGQCSLYWLVIGQHVLGLYTDSEHPEDEIALILQVRNRGSERPLDFLKILGLLSGRVGLKSRIM